MVHLSLMAAVVEIEQVGIIQYLKQPWDLLLQDHLGKAQLSGLSQEGDHFIRGFAVEYELPMQTLGCYAVILSDELCEEAEARLERSGLVVYAP